MTEGAEIIQRLTGERLPFRDCLRELKSFSLASDWRPSDALEETESASAANGHLIVEHGLDPTAVISFLGAGRRFGALEHEQRFRLLSISYNNLVEWHVFHDREGMTVVFNRRDPIKPIRVQREEQPDYWTARAFDRIVGRRPSPNLKRLDDALMDTLSFWKRCLAAELDQSIATEDISALFNAILLIRAVEDHRRQQRSRYRDSRLLIDCLQRDPPPTLRSCIQACLEQLEIGGAPTATLDLDRLASYDSLHQDTVGALFRDFYSNKFAPYAYDFSVISKHSLSRIYERYVSQLVRKESAQQEMFPSLPQEVDTLRRGSVYTPQFIARFFAHFLKENLPPPGFRKLRVVDPACGSGIFLRTVLEMQCDPLQVDDVRSVAEEAYRRVLGIDVDENACNATRLSLSLLHLALTGTFPRDLRIEQGEAVEYLQDNSELEGAFDAVIANPPFVPWDRIPEDWKARIQKLLNEHARGRIDLFLALLKLGMKMLCPGGFLLYVLPHSFLKMDSARRLRSWISEHYWVRFIVDLSSVRVFESAGVYVILLVLQKKPSYELEEPRAVVVDCKEFAGHALQDALVGKRETTPHYQIYELTQAHFQEATWDLGPPSFSSLMDKCSRLPTLGEFLHVREGFITGMDDVFIRERGEVPDGEEAIYVPYLSDREMREYSTPGKTKRVLFFPFLEGEALDERDIQRRFKKTWRYLVANKTRLEERKSLVSNRSAWWRPIRPRTPETMLRPKIVSPHLVLLPRFSLDQKGKYAVSHCPLMYPKMAGDDLHLLRFFLAILNSSVSYWQLMRLSHRYSKGYLMLEPKTLKKLRVPGPARIQPEHMKRIQSLVKECVRLGPSEERRRELDQIVGQLYELSSHERSLVGMQT